MPNDFGPLRSGLYEEMVREYRKEYMRRMDAEERRIYEQREAERRRRQEPPLFRPYVDWAEVERVTLEALTSSTAPSVKKIKRNLPDWF